MSEEYQFHTRQKSDLFSYPYRMERGELLFCLQGGVQLYINQQKYALAFFVSGTGCVFASDHN